MEMRTRFEIKIGDESLRKDSVLMCKYLDTLVRVQEGDIVCIDKIRHTWTEVRKCLFDLSAYNRFIVELKPIYSRSVEELIDKMCSNGWTKAE